MYDRAKIKQGARPLLIEEVSMQKKMWRNIVIGVNNETTCHT